jgi:hypothetical protein
MHGRLRRLLLTGVLPAAIGVAAVVALLVRQRDGAVSRTALAQLAAKNYRVLTRDQSRMLVRYADDVHRCLVGHGAKIARPVAWSTRITMRAPHQSARSLAQLMMACDATVGAPPAKASLQARTGSVLLYLPKQCLLDPTQLPAGA